jgi:hypothetical protein
MYRDQRLKFKSNIIPKYHKFINFITDINGGFRF